VIHDAESSGLFVRKLQAGMTMVEVEMKSGQSAVMQSHLEILQKEADAKGLFLFSQKAASMGRNH
jgi:hypothetical protein